jgi:hypothetical protein
MPILQTVVLWPTPMKFPKCQYFEECTLVSGLKVIMYIILLLLLYRATGGCVPQPYRLIVLTLCCGSSHLHRQAPPRLQRRERPLEGKGNYGREMTGNFADIGGFHAIVGIFYMGTTAALLPLRRKACWGNFRPENPTASAGFEPANLDTKGQHAYP